jgi:hypothetical protein
LTSLLSAALFVTVLLSLRRSHIRVEHSVSWLAASALVFVLSRFESIWANLSGWMGISYPPLALVVTALAVFLAVFYRFSRIVSSLKEANVALAQKVAILEFEARRAGGTDGAANRLNSAWETPPSDRRGTGA